MRPQRSAEGPRPAAKSHRLRPRQPRPAANNLPEPTINSAASHPRRSAAGRCQGGPRLAVRWDCPRLACPGTLKVDYTIGRIGKQLVTSEPKTDRSRRTVPLSATVVAMLRRHRTAQKREQMAAANQWTDTGLVFTTALGHAVEPRNLLRVIETAAKVAGIEEVGIHTLRHSAAVDWLEAGVHIKAVADLLGHSSISVTGELTHTPQPKQAGSSGFTTKTPGRESAQ